MKYDNDHIEYLELKSKASVYDDRENLENSTVFTFLCVCVWKNLIFRSTSSQYSQFPYFIH